jgi:8-oxo-dGTP pyrophosphatase MutT (NUDIX family)
MNKLREVLSSVVSDSFHYGDGFHPEREVNSKASVAVIFSGLSFEESNVLLILRSMSVATHAGQVAFPGGGVEDIDGDDRVATAFRETREETGLSPSGIEALGLLPNYPTVTGGFHVTPVLCMAKPEASLQAFQIDPKEVAHAEWVPISSLIASRTEETRLVRGQEMALPVFDWGGRKMWGLTALIFDLILKRYARL